MSTLSEQTKAAEQALTACLLLDPSQAGTVARLIGPGDFASEGLAAVFEAIADLRESGIRPDLQSVVQKMMQDGTIQSAGGASFLSELTENVFSGENAGHHARTVLELALKRKVRSLCRQGEALAVDGSEPAEVLDTLSGELERIRLRLPGGRVAPRHRLLRAAELKCEPVAWAVGEILPRNALTVFFGDPESGKSFLAIDLACSIGAGKPWHGRSVRAGWTAYVAGEGLNSLWRRFAGWCARHQVALRGLPVFVSQGPFVLTDQEGVDALTGAIQAVAEAEGSGPALIVVDTLARCFGGNDENSTRDMNSFVNGVSRLREAFHCACLIVHHSGLASKDRTRGNSALRASVDAEWRVTRDGAGIIRLHCTKSKDSDRPDPLAFRLASVGIPGLANDDGSPAHTVVPESMPYTEPVDSSKGLGKNQRMALDVLRRLLASCGIVTEGSWRLALKDAGMSRNRVKDTIEGLYASGAVLNENGSLSLFS